MGFESGLNPYIGGLATFIIGAGTLAWNNHLVLPGLWMVTAGGVFSTFAFCVGYKNWSHAARMLVLVSASVILLCAASTATVLLHSHPEMINNTTNTSTQSGPQTDARTTNSAKSDGDHSAAVAGNGNTVIYSASEDDVKSAKKKRK